MNFFAAFGERVIFMIAYVGALSSLTMQTFRALPQFNWNRTLYQASKLGVDSILIVTIISVFMGMVMTYQLAAKFVEFGAQSVAGGAVFIALAR